VPLKQKASFLHFALVEHFVRPVGRMRGENPSLPLRGTQNAQHNAQRHHVDDRDCRADPVDDKRAGTYDDSGTRARLGTAMAMRAQ
jgi:hypothetical protein